jgi:hypothetical protein
VIRPEPRRALRETLPQANLDLPRLMDAGEGHHYLSLEQVEAVENLGEMQPGNEDSRGARCNLFSHYCNEFS